MFDKPNVCPLCKSPALENDKLRFTCGSGYDLNLITHEHTFFTTQYCTVIKAIKEKEKEEVDPKIYKTTMHKTYRAQQLWKKFRSGKWDSYAEMKSSTDELDCFFGLSTNEIVKEMNKETNSNETKEKTMILENNKKYMCDLFENETFTMEELQDKLQSELEDGYITVDDINGAEFWKVEPVTLYIDITQTVEIRE